MKSILIVVGSLISAVTTSFCAERFDPVTWRNFQSYDVATLKQIEKGQVGKFVALHFNYRSNRVRHIKPNWFEASLWQHNPQEKSGYSHLRVYVARKDLPAFRTIPTDFRSTADHTVWGQVQKDADANYVFTRLFGRKTSVDAKGNTIVDW